VEDADDIGCAGGRAPTESCGDATGVVETIRDCAAAIGRRVTTSGCAGSSIVDIDFVTVDSVGDTTSARCVDVSPRRGMGAAPLIAIALLHTKGLGLAHHHTYKKVAS
jgi:hypothetical protein